ncbi:hypothetical protein COLO4_05146 [Corchorus olitorius]|uniref:Uncharacterized protein n=1 Tax=Corchorus olitorius TaxID=93759 RepID=A0A1R3KRP9_9ROSI|nr:hypothetical protein COLO4_05146 [Corchorus olitorius]
MCCALSCSNELLWMFNSFDELHVVDFYTLLLSPSVSCTLVMA